MTVNFSSMSAPSGLTIPWIPATPAYDLTSDQRLVLRGDATRPTKLAQQKAIWEKWPDNKTYMHNYVTRLMSSGETELGTTPEQCRTAFLAEISRLQRLDPDNARFDYILAGRLLQEAVEDDNQRSDPHTVVKNRARLDEAMAHFKAGLAKPEFRRYSREMMAERLAIMGKPTSLLQNVHQIGVAAGVLLPDLANIRNLQRKALFYGELLADEGRREEADVFLNAYSRFVPHINDDAFTLIGVLVVGAIAHIAEERVPAIYERLGDAAAAEHARRQAATLAAPVKRWKEKIKAVGAGRTAQQLMVERHGATLTRMLLPALGEEEYPTLEELAPGRMLEYATFDGLALTLMSLILFVVMILLVLSALYYRFIRPGRTSSFLLLPEGSEMAGLMAYGVLAPLLGYYFMTRCMPGGAREWVMTYTGPVVLAQQVTLLLVITGVTLTIAGRSVRRRCTELLLPVPPPPAPLWKIGGLVLIGLTACIGFLPFTVLRGIGAWMNVQLGCTDPIFYALVLASPALILLFGIVHGITRDIRHGRRCAAYYGSFARALITALALTLILVNICSRPYLRISERQLCAEDTLMRSPPDGGFTSIEMRVTRRLQAEVQQAAREILEPSQE